MKKEIEKRKQRKNEFYQEWKSRRWIVSFVSNLPSPVANHLTIADQYPEFVFPKVEIQNANFPNAVRPTISKIEFTLGSACYQISLFWKWWPFFYYFQDFGYLGNWLSGDLSHSGNWIWDIGFRILKFVTLVFRTSTFWILATREIEFGILVSGF